MPLMTYKCEKCGKTTEELSNRVPQCKCKGKLKKIYQAGSFGFKLHGGGVYSNNPYSTKGKR